MSIDNQNGISIIELMIAVVIMAVLFSIGLPSFTTYLANAKLRTATESFLSGLQLARSEAVRRNSNVQFVLTNDAPIAANVSTATATANGRNWLIRTADLSVFIEGKSGAEGSGGDQDNAPKVQIDSGGTSTITFTSLGVSTLTTVTNIRFTNPSAGNCQSDSPVGPIRCLNVVVSSGGQSRMCDPAVTTAGDTRGC